MGHMDKIDIAQRWFEEHITSRCGYTLFNNILWHIYTTKPTLFEIEGLLNGIGLSEKNIKDIHENLVTLTFKKEE